MPNRRFGFVVGISLIWALLVSWVFYRVAGHAGAQVRKVEPEKALVVATQSLPLGTLLTRETVRLGSTPERLFPNGGFSRIEDVLDRPVISAIGSDEPIVE